MQKKNLKQRGFTLMELLVVIAIIGILSTIVVSSVQAARDRGRIAAGQTFSHNIQSGIADATLVAEYLFEEGSGTTLVDNWGTHNGTINGSPSPSWTTGIKGQALSFNGSTQYVSIPLSADINNLSVSPWTYANKTVELWFYANTVAPVRQVIYEQGGGGPAGGTSTGGLNVYLFGSTLYTGIWCYEWPTNWGKWFNTTISAGKWYHVALVYSNSNTVAMYVDGKLINKDSVINAYQANGGDVNIGRNGNTRFHDDSWMNNQGYIVGHFFNGKVDELRLYNGALGMAEIQKHYAIGFLKHMFEKIVF